MNNENPSNLSHTGNSEQCKDVGKPASCCAPRSSHLPTITPACPVAAITRHTPKPSALSNRKMVSLPGDTFLMGTDYPHGFLKDGEGPIRQVSLSPFEIDIYPVTNEDFVRFVDTTGYRTEAEAFGWSFVFWSHIPPERFEELVENTAAQTPWWCKVPGASWKQPEGPGSSVESRLKHPVVHVSWNDAASYAAWAGKSLPTEAQWEYAARGGLHQKLYSWGDELTPGGKHLCNIWQGQFPLEDTAEDGYAGTCPVDAFPPNGYGIYSATGNVWEWCSDWFDTEFRTSPMLHDPAGPPTGAARAMKGGSFLCHASYCNRYRVAARTSNTPDSSASNIGFRCAKALSSSSGN
ncbi:SUMF1/EgtB/PvdO family nonheme iron enzyme [Granulicella sp. 5B5]|uniref:formylglycine-generating enzyme family protein n=1 Tax=Granulicella sp. 5B5 TaxID=1617967 RepID=UPI0015F482DD|nr:formylglycine-generating enzyme family protein [Granulicella sp. 5B5]QMV19748.1 SUMF1/EgtB/PvdO family nonheme iron enzyme [Granulicella sp. 5B5]